MVTKTNTELTDVHKYTTECLQQPCKWNKMMHQYRTYLQNELNLFTWS